MKLLVLGGTGFVGRCVVEEAVRRGVGVTVLNRGLRQAPDGVTALTGDRTQPDGLDAVSTGTWDVVVDTWSAAPYVVRDSARSLARRTQTYAYVSSRSVYRWPPSPGLAENGPLVDGAGPDGGEDGQKVMYAQAKRGSEIAVLDAFGDRALLARAGLILGPYEDVGRLPWWLNRLSRGGTVPAPGPADLGLQYIDARDLAWWLLDAAEQDEAGAFNVVSPPGFTTMGELLQACIAVTGSDAELRWLTPESIAAAGVEAWTDLPIYLPPGKEHDGLHAGNVDKALAAGLRCRPVQETVQDTWDWLLSLPSDPPQRADRPHVGLSEEAEARLLASR